MSEPLWSDDDMDAAMAACNLDDGSKERVKAMLEAVRDGYESFISSVNAQNDALFDRATKRLARIKELEAQLGIYPIGDWEFSHAPEPEPDPPDPPDDYDEDSDDDKPHYDTPGGY